MNPMAHSLSRVFEAIFVTSVMMICVPNVSAFAQGTQQLLDANGLLDRALENRDHAAVDGLLDPEFSWVFPDGSHYYRPDILRSLPMPRAGIGNGAEVMERIYGTKVGVIQVFSGPFRGLRVWARRSAGWRIVHMHELDTTRADSPAPAVPLAQGFRYRDTLTADQLPDCENPCTVMPYEPTTPRSKATLDSWMGQEVASAAMDINPEDGWAYYVADENVGQRSGNGGQGNPKLRRIATTLRRIEAGVEKSAQSVVLHMRLVDLEDAVLMVMIGQPLDGKPSWNSRVFVPNVDRYQMAASYGTIIRDVPSYRQLLE